MQAGRVRCPSERSSLQLVLNVLCLHCQKPDMTHCFKAFCLESALLIWALVFFLLSSLLTLPVASFCFETCASLPVRSSGQTQDNRGQKFCFPACGSSRLGVLEGGSAQLVIVCLGAFPHHLLCGCLGLMNILNWMSQWVI